MSMSLLLPRPSTMRQGPRESQRAASLGLSDIKPRASSTISSTERYRPNDRSALRRDNKDLTASADNTSANAAAPASCCFVAVKSIRASTIENRVLLVGRLAGNDRV
ncbi:MAG: hypothetical protein ACK4MF_09760 [Hyphomicrobiaceae bacterium]